MLVERVIGERVIGDNLKIKLLDVVLIHFI